MGSFYGIAVGNLTIVNVTAAKQVRCIDDWNDLSSPRTTPHGDLKLHTQYTKCIRTGKGWSVVNEVTGFQIRNRTALQKESGADNDIIFNIYFTDKSTYFNETTDFGSGLGACLIKVSRRDCDWNVIFSHPLPYNLSRMSTNSLIVKMSGRLIEEMSGRFIVEMSGRSSEEKKASWIDFTSYPL